MRMIIFYFLLGDTTKQSCSGQRNNYEEKFIPFQQFMWILPYINKLMSLINLYGSNMRFYIFGIKYLMNIYGVIIYRIYGWGVGAVGSALVS